MSPGNNEGPNKPSILEIDLKNTKKKKWLNMYPSSGQQSNGTTATDPPHQQHHNNLRNGKSHHQNEQNVTRNGNGTTANGNGTTTNGNGITTNGNGTTTNGYTNGNTTNGTTNGLNGNAKISNGNSHRESGHVWTPLLQTESTPPDPTTELYSPSNNNDWKESEDINNFKNGLHHKANGNNNGSMRNGKNGLGLLDKYDEQEPLTGGLYRPQIIPTRSKDHDDDHDEADLPEMDSGCGLFGFRPRWARNFASTHVFMVIFLLAWVLQGMYMTYFVSVITTIEKLFQIKSRTTGLLLSASEMGQISTAMLLTYYAGRGHRPRWIACGMVIFAIASFSCALPHFIFGKQLMQSTALMNGGGASSLMEVHNNQQHLLNSSSLGYTLSSVSSDMNLNLCLASSGNGTHNSNSDCEEDVKLEQASQSKITVIVLCIFFVSLLSSGIGQTAVATLGIPYIDDNVASRQSPIYMAITIGVRILGPTAGFIVGSFCTRWYVDFTVPAFDATDPRWIGAWWLGPVVIGSLMMLASIAMFSFPKQLRGRRQPDAATEKSALSEPEEKPRLRDFPKTVRRQLSNDILMFRTASSVFHLLPIAGLTTFLPKYLETQFRLPAADANLIAAFGGILVMGIGIFISGIVILKLKPTARSVAAWIAFTAFFYASGMVILMFVGCNMNDFAGLKSNSNETSAIFEPTCNLNCTCDMEKFSPICGSDGKTYFSSCHAGCTSLEIRGNRTVYSNCQCILPDVKFEKKTHEATSGYCDSSCKNFIGFILIFAGCVFMHSTSEVGSMLLIMRCTHPKDKAMALGVIQSAIGLFGNVPCPIIYGAVIDSACLVWKTVCGKHGACSLYDIEAFRHNFLGITAGIMFLAFLMDLIVWSKAHRIDITPEEEAEKEAKIDPECIKPITAPDTTV